MIAAGPYNPCGYDSGDEIEEEEISRYVMTIGCWLRLSVVVVCFLRNLQRSTLPIESCKSPNIDASRIAKKRPLETSFRATFVLDISKLSHHDDVKKDMYGRELYSGSQSDVFLCSYSESGQVAK